MKKNSLDSVLTGYRGTEVADGLILRKKKSANWCGVSLGEGSLTLVETAPAVTFITAPLPP